MSLARWRSKDMVDRDYFDHTIKGTSYQVYHWYDHQRPELWGGENIGWNNGYSDADSPIKIHEGFMASPGHRANILDPSFTHGGVGAYGKDGVDVPGQGPQHPHVHRAIHQAEVGTATASAARPTGPPPPIPPAVAAEPRPALPSRERKPGRNAEATARQAPRHRAPRRR